MAHLSDFLHQIHAHGGDWVAFDVGDDRRFAPSRSPDVLFYVVLSGELRIRTRPGRTVTLRPSDVAMVFGGAPHVFETGRPLAEAAFTYFDQPHDLDAPPSLRLGGHPVAARVLVGKVRISWPAALRPAGLPPCLHLHMGPTEASEAEIVGLFTRSQSGPGASAYLTKLAELAMLRTLRENVELLRRLPPDNASLQIARALKLIEGAPGASWSVHRLAREIGMSRSSFAEKFVQHTGNSPMEVVTEARMRFASELLDAEPLSLPEVAQRSGYRSEAAFSRRFERHFGTTPGRYRRQSRDHRRTLWPRLLDPAVLADIS